MRALKAELNSHSPRSAVRPHPSHHWPDSAPPGAERRQLAGRDQSGFESSCAWAARSISRCSFNNWRSVACVVASCDIVSCERMRTMFARATKASIGVISAPSTAGQISRFSAAPRAFQQTAGGVVPWAIPAPRRHNVARGAVAQQQPVARSRRDRVFFAEDCHSPGLAMARTWLAAPLSQVAASTFSPMSASPVTKPGPSTVAERGRLRIVLYHC